MKFQFSITVLLLHSLQVTEAIYNGTAALPGLYRWHTLLSRCGASLISSKVGITACHCISESERPSVIVLDRSMRVVNDVEEWKRDPWYNTVVQVKVADQDRCGQRGDKRGIDYALFELEKEVPVCDDSRFGPMALMLPYLTNKELHFTNLLKHDKDHQCVFNGYGKELPEKKKENGRFPSTMTFRANQFRLDNDLDKEQVSFGVDHTTIAYGDSGSPLFCIYEDIPYLVTVASTLSSGKPAGAGPNLQKKLGNIEKMAKEMGVWKNIEESQKKCGDYYQKYGFIKDYLDKIKTSSYKPKPAGESFYQTDYYEYPEVDAVDTDGSHRN